MIDVTVIVCAHNPRSVHLERTLDSIRAQVLSYDRWELLLIDNNSSSPLANAWDLSWHPNGRHVLETELGLASARRRGIIEATGRLLLFVDDDNVLAPDYLTEALRIEAAYSFLGAWGSGAIVPEFELEPADYLSPYVGWLAIRHVNQPVWSNVISCHDAVPVGAGLCIRRVIGASYLEYSQSELIQISDRKGSSLGGHGDVELAYLACKNGLGMGLFPSLKLVHLIPKERVSEQYFLKIIEGTVVSGTLLDYKWKGTSVRPPFSARGMVSIFKNLVLKRGFERRLYLANLRGTITASRQLNRYQMLSTSAGTKRQDSGKNLPAAP